MASQANERETEGHDTAGVRIAYTALLDIISPDFVGDYEQFRETP